MTKFLRWLFPDNTEKHDRIAMNTLLAEGRVTDPGPPHMRRAFDRLVKRGEAVKVGETYQLPPGS